MSDNITSSSSYGMSGASGSGASTTLSSASNVIAASALINSFGINTKASYEGADAYDNAALIIRDLNYIGIHTVREGLRATGMSAAIVAQLADAGVKFDFGLPISAGQNGSGGIDAFVASVANFAVQHPGSVIAIEGQNEVDVFGTNYTGDTSLSAAAEIQKYLYSSVKSNPLLSGVSVYNLTTGGIDSNILQSIGDLGSYSDYANAHIYSGTASNIEQRFLQNISAADVISSGHATVVTETGVTTLDGSSHLSVDEYAQAKMDLSALLRGYAQGASLTYLYQLFDTPDIDPGNSSLGAANNYFGLFNADGSPKLAATALHNFTTLIGGDNGSAIAGSFQVQGLGSDGELLNVAKSSGATDLILWRDISSWDSKTDTAAVVTPTQVVITFDTVQAHVYVYSPADSLTPVASYENVSSITLNLADAPLVVELGANAPFVDAPVHADSDTISVDGRWLAAHLDELSHTTGLTTIHLTGDHILPVASIETLNDIRANYAGVLGKIDGEYNFDLQRTGSGWQTDTLYDKAGNLLSTSELSLTGTTPKSRHVDYPSGATDDYTYTNGVVTREVHVAADGSRQTISRNSSGQVVSSQDLTTSGVSTYQTFDPASGVATTRQVTNVDKSGYVEHYGITGQSYVADKYVYAAGSVLTGLTRYHTDGTLDYAAQYGADGGKFVENFDAAGHKVKQSTQNADGSSSVINYNIAGQATGRQDTAADGTYTARDYNPASGAVTRLTITHPDKSSEISHYGVTGQSYTSDHYVYDQYGTATSVTRYHVDGTTDYAAQYHADGSRLVTNYDATGHKTVDTATAADGGTIVTSYDTRGTTLSVVERAADGTYSASSFDAATGTLTRLTVTHADKSGDLYHYGVTGQSYVSDHYVYGVGGALSALTRYHADGTLDYAAQYGAAGTSSTTTYDAAGKAVTRQDVSSTGVTTAWTYDPKTAAVLVEKITNADQSGDTYHYGITGQSYVSDHYVYGAGGAVRSVTRSHANGTLDSSTQYNPDGSSVVDSYDATGHKLTETRTGADGGTAILSYNLDGQLISSAGRTAANVVTGSSYDPVSGALLRQSVTNPDKSGDLYHFGVTGQKYTSDHYVYAPGGALFSISRLHDDGTFSSYEQYNANGSKLVDTYDAVGRKTLEVITAADGSKAFHTYAEVSDQDTATTNLFAGTALKGTLSIVGTPSVQVVDDKGNVLHALDPSAYTIKNGTLTLHADGVAGNLSVGSHAFVEVRYAVTDGVTLAPTSVYSLQVDGTNPIIHVDASTFVSDIDQLSAIAGVTAIQLTSDSTLQVASAQAIQDLTTKYASLFGKIVGEYDFAVLGSGDGWTSRTLYDQDGDLISTSTYNYQDGVVATLNVVNADGSTSTTSYDTNGHVSWVTERDADGTYSGSNFDLVTGALTRLAITHSDKSGDLYHYGVTGQRYVSDHFAYAPGGALESLSRYHADGTLDYHADYQADGSRVVDNYDATGHLTLETFMGADGSRSTTNYNLNGLATNKVEYAADGTYSGSNFDPVTGALTRLAITHTDKSGDLYHYGVTGQRYVSDHYAYATGGALESLSRHHADGTLDYYTEYHADGSRVVDNYDATGHLTLETLIGASTADVFHVSQANTTITNFTVNQGDKIDLSRIDAISGNQGGTLDHFTLAGSTFTSVAGQLIVHKDPANGDGNHWIVEGDATGDGHADYLIHLTTLSGHVPTASDFILG